MFRWKKIGMWDFCCDVVPSYHMTIFHYV